MSLHCFLFYMFFTRFFPSHLQEKIAENYRKIRFRPDQFTEYLLSREVGFSKCETLTLPHKKGKTNTFGSGTFSKFSFVNHKPKATDVLHRSKIYLDTLPVTVIGN